MKNVRSPADRTFAHKWLWFAAVMLLLTNRLPSQTFPQKVPDHPAIANFIDIAGKAGLTAVNVFGGVDTKKYIIETTGTGVAILDYDNDGWPEFLSSTGPRSKISTGQSTHQPSVPQQS